MHFYIYLTMIINIQKDFYKFGLIRPYNHPVGKPVTSQDAQKSSCHLATQATVVVTDQTMAILFSYHTPKQ